MKLNIVNRLLRKNMSVAQLCGFTLSNFIGLTIVIVGLQFFLDVRTLWDDEDSFIRKDYVVINKKVTGASTMDSSASGFSAPEISDLESQDWVRKVGRFRSNDYRLYASVQSGGRGMSTYMFFESVPSEFIDIPHSDWNYRPGDRQVPIIISKDYLSLYNFGFAGSSGLPKMSEGMIGSVPLTLRIIPENGKPGCELTGRVVGFSSRLNTILVPEEFMDWSNNAFGATAASSQSPSRLILDVSSPGDVRIADYMDSHGYEIAGDKSGSAASYFLNIGAAVVLAVGVLITVLSFFILALSISLLMQKNRDKLHSLLMLGYPLREVGAPYRRIVIAVSCVSLLMACIAMLLIRNMYISAVEAMGAEDGGVIVSIGVGLALALLTVLFNTVSVSRRVRKAF